MVGVLWTVQSQCSLAVCCWSVRAKHVLPVFRLRIVPGLAISLLLEMLWKTMGREAHSSAPCSRLAQHRGREQCTGAEGHPAMFPAPLLCMFSALLNLFLSFLTYCVLPALVRKQPRVYDSVFLTAEITVVRQEQIAIFCMPPVENILKIFPLAGMPKSWQGHSNTVGSE